MRIFLMMKNFLEANKIENFLKRIEIAIESWEMQFCHFWFSSKLSFVNSHLNSANSLWSHFSCSFSFIILHTLLSCHHTKQWSTLLKRVRPSLAFYDKWIKRFWSRRKSKKFLRVVDNKKIFLHFYYRDFNSWKFSCWNIYAIFFASVYLIFDVWLRFPLLK